MPTNLDSLKNTNVFLLSLDKLSTMKKIILFFLFISFTQALLASDSKTYFRADYGMGRFKSDKLDSLNANPKGSTFGIAFGSKMSYVEVGIFYRNFSFDADITHDSSANQILHKGNTFGLDLNVFLNNHLSLKIGYAVNNYKQSFANSMSASSLSAAKNSYGIEDNKSSSNIFYGANVDIFSGKTWDLYTSIIQFPMGDGKSTLTAQVGIRFYMNKSFSYFFGQ